VATLVLASVVVAGVVWYGPFGGFRGNRQSDGPFVASQQPGAVVTAADYRLSGPYTHNNLSVYLVHGSETLEGKKFITLQESLEQKNAIVHETSSVGELAIENHSQDADLFVQSGDIVKGGKQDRTLPYDTLIGANSGRVPISSFCVEQSRWSKRGDESSSYFSSSSENLATSEMKRSASSPGEASQQAVWTNVAKTQSRLEKKLGASVQADASKSSLQLTLESAAVKAAREPYVKALATILDGKTDVIGCVVVVNGRVVSADAYSSRDLFRKLWPKLLASSALEAFLESDAARGAMPASEQDVRTFLSEGETGKPVSEAVTERTYVHIRRSDKVILIESCDRARDNLVLHRSFISR